MTGGWNAGDMALCVRGGSWINCDGEKDRGPRTGGVYMVAGTASDARGLALALAGLPRFYRAVQFRKIEPPKIEAEEVRRELLLA